MLTNTNPLNNSGKRLFLLNIILFTIFLAPSSALPVFKNLKLPADTAQVALPGGFLAPFAFLNNVPSTGLDVGTDGKPDIFPECRCRSLQYNQGATLPVGYFDGQIIVASGVSGQQWKLDFTQNLLDPITLKPILLGTLIPEIENSGIYVLPFAHAEGATYEFDVKTNNSSVYGALGNPCYYPHPEILGIDSFYCYNEPAFALSSITYTGFDQNTFPIFSGNSNWTIRRVDNGETIFDLIFDPEEFGPGRYEIKYNFNGNPNPSLATNRTGCSTVVTEKALIRGDFTMACHNGLNLSINSLDCSVEIIPQMILAAKPYTYDKIRVELYGPNGKLPNNIITPDLVEKSITAVVIDECDESFCSATLIAFDYAAPELTIPADINLKCYEAPDVSRTGSASAKDCSSFTLTYSDQTIETLCGSPRARILRSWKAVDRYGNTTTKVQTIGINRATNNDFLFPADITYSCKDYGQDPTITNAAPGKAGIPTNVEVPFCGLSYTWVDDTLRGCGDPRTNFIIARTWKVLDFCQSPTLFEFDANANDNLQLIRVIDDAGPTVEALPVVVSVNLSAQESGFGDCTSTGLIPPPNAFDACNEVREIFIRTPIGEAVYVNGQDGSAGGKIPEPGLPLGTYPIEYEAIDVCGNRTVVTSELKVVDDVSPVMVCKRSVNLSLSSIGEARLFPNQIDEGSYDLCCDGPIKIKLEEEPDSSFRDFAEFYCVTDTFLAIVRKWDCYGNFNDCLAEVYITDVQAPRLAGGVPDTTILCGSDLTTFHDKTYRAPSFIDNCPLEISFETHEAFDTCGKGVLTRIWTASDGNGNPAVSFAQKVTITGGFRYHMQIPADTTLGCRDSLLSSLNPVSDTDCNILYSYYIEESEIKPGEDNCLVRKRYHRLINWCEYDGTSPPTFLPRFDGPDQDVADGDSYLFYSENGKIYLQNGPITQELGNSTGYYEYQQRIVSIDTTGPEMLFSAIEPICTYNYEASLGVQCLGKLDFPFEIEDKCSQAVSFFYNLNFNRELITIDTYGELVELPEGKYAIRGDYPKGKHEFIFTVYDACGNIKKVTLPFEVLDCQEPQILCKINPTFFLDSTGAITLHPADLVEDVFDNCKTTRLSFSADAIMDALAYTCDSVGARTAVVHVADEAGNSGFCHTSFEIADPSNACIDSFSISGQIADLTGKQLANIRVNLDGHYKMDRFTTGNGNFSFQPLPEGYAYTITPLKDDDFLNGVSTLDLILMSRHILSVKPLGSPYRVIAGDINRSGSITTLDIILLRKLILGIDDRFRTNTSWRFVPSDFQFTDEMNPFLDNFPEKISIDPLTGDTLARFVAIKTGDVNESADPYNSSGIKPRSDTTAIYNLQWLEQPSDDEKYTAFVADIPEQVAGIQFSLQWAGQYSNIASLLMENDSDPGQMNIQENQLHFTWHGTVSAQPGRKLKLVVNHRQGNLFSLQNIKTEPCFLHPEIYFEQIDGTIKVEKLQINFFHIGKNHSFAHLNIHPNPFRDGVNVGIYLPLAFEDYRLYIRDLQGKTVSGPIKMQSSFTKIHFSKTLFPLPGVYLCQLISTKESITQKLVFLGN